MTPSASSRAIDDTVGQGGGVVRAPKAADLKAESAGPRPVWPPGRLRCLEEKQSFVVGGVQLDVHPESDTLAHKRSLNAGQLFIVIHSQL